MFTDEEVDAGAKGLFGLSIGWMVLILLVFIGGAVGIGYKAIFDPIEEEIRHNTYKRSTAHIEGSIRTIEKYRIEYLQEENPAAKKAIGQMILREAENLEERDIPEHLKSIINEVRSPQ
jgi:hypothetical protein